MREQIRRYASREERQIGRRDVHLPQGHCFEDTGRRDLHEKKMEEGKGSGESETRVAFAHAIRISIHGLQFRVALSQAREFYLARRERTGWVGSEGRRGARKNEALKRRHRPYYSVNITFVTWRGCSTGRWEIGGYTRGSCVYFAFPNFLRETARVMSLSPLQLLLSSPLLFSPCPLALFTRPTNCLFVLHAV